MKRPKRRNSSAKSPSSKRIKNLKKRASVRKKTVQASKRQNRSKK